MNRAFVRESDAEEPPALPPMVSPLPPGTRNYLTPEGAQRLRAELARLTEEDCPALAAAPSGDLEAQSRLRFLQQRVDYLRQSLQIAEIVPPLAGELESARFGAFVTVAEDDGRESQYRIVGVDETDLSRNWVSWISPIGKALMHASPGQTVSVRMAGGLKTLEVLSIHG